jgi:RNA polymerase sigma-70 factor (ECF subfamily)
LNYTVKYNSDTVTDNPEATLSVYLARAIKGDERAFREIYNLYSSKMYSVCTRYAGNTNDADDVFQEGFIKVYKNLAAFKGLGSFEGWVRKIFVHTCLDFLRRKKDVYRTTDLENKEEMLTADTGDIMVKMSTDELHKIIQGLPHGYRTIVNLYLVEGYSHNEIADMLQISEGTSKSQLSRAKIKLQEVIKVYNG